MYSEEIRELESELAAAREEDKKRASEVAVMQRTCKNREAKPQPPPESNAMSAMIFLLPICIIEIFVYDNI